MIRESSQEAYEITKSSMADAKSRACIIDVLMRMPERDLTRGEIAEILQKPINKITPRVLELLEAGVLEQLPERRKTSLSQVACHSVKLTSEFLKRAA